MFAHLSLHWHWIVFGLVTFLCNVSSLPGSDLFVRKNALFHIISYYVRTFTHFCFNFELFFAWLHYCLGVGICMNKCIIGSTGHHCRTHWSVLMSESVSSFNMKFLHKTEYSPQTPSVCVSNMKNDSLHGKTSNIILL